MSPASSSTRSPPASRAAASRATASIRGSTSAAMRTSGSSRSLETSRRPMNPGKPVTSSTAGQATPPRPPAARLLRGPAGDQSSMAAPAAAAAADRQRRPLLHQLWLWVIVGIVAGVVFGLVAPDSAEKAKWLADAFIQLIKAITGPVIFVTVVIGIASLGNLARAGGLAPRAPAHFFCAPVVPPPLRLPPPNIVPPRPRF